MGSFVGAVPQPAVDLEVLLFAGSWHAPQSPDFGSHSTNASLLGLSRLTVGKAIKSFGLSDGFLTNCYLRVPLGLHSKIGHYF